MFAKVFQSTEEIPVFEFSDNDVGPDFIGEDSVHRFKRFAVRHGFAFHLAVFADNPKIEIIKLFQ